MSLRRPAEPEVVPLGRRRDGRRDAGDAVGGPGAGGAGAVRGVDGGGTAAARGVPRATLRQERARGAARGARGHFVTVSVRPEADVHCGGYLLLVCSISCFLV